MFVCFSRFFMVLVLLGLAVGTQPGDEFVSSGFDSKNTEMVPNGISSEQEAVAGNQGAKGAISEIKKVVTSLPERQNSQVGIRWIKGIVASFGTRPGDKGDRPDTVFYRNGYEGPLVDINSTEFVGVSNPYQDSFDPERHRISVYQLPSIAVAGHYLGSVFHNPGFFLHSEWARDIRRQSLEAGLARPDVICYRDYINLEKVSRYDKAVLWSAIKAMGSVRSQMAFGNLFEADGVDEVRGRDVLDGVRCLSVSFRYEADEDEACINHMRFTAEEIERFDIHSIDHRMIEVVRLGGLDGFFDDGGLFLVLYARQWESLGGRISGDSSIIDRLAVCGFPLLILVGPEDDLDSVFWLPGE